MRGKKATGSRAGLRRHVHDLGLAAADEDLSSSFFSSLCGADADASRGCVRVKPYERELLAKPTMTFQPDPHEDVLDNHMLEAREGAAGGYGSAGGGCGCN